MPLFPYLLFPVTRLSYQESNQDQESYPGIETTDALRAKNRLADEALLGKFNRLPTLRSFRCPEDCELRPEREFIVLSSLKLCHADRPNRVGARSSSALRMVVQKDLGVGVFYVGVLIPL